MITMAAENLALRKIETFISGLRSVLFSKYHCQVTNRAITMRETPINVPTHGVDQPSTLPSVNPKRRTRSPMVIRVPPTQSTLVLMLMGPSLMAGGGITTYPRIAMIPARIANTQNTHFQLRYSPRTPPWILISGLRE